MINKPGPASTNLRWVLFFLCKKENKDFDSMTIFIVYCLKIKNGKQIMPIKKVVVVVVVVFLCKRQTNLCFLLVCLAMAAVIKTTSVVAG